MRKIIMRWTLAPLNFLVFFASLGGFLSCLIWLPHAWGERLTEPEDLWGVAVIGGVCLLLVPVSLVNALHQFGFQRWLRIRPPKLVNGSFAAIFASIGIAGFFETGVTAREMIAMFAPAGLFLCSVVFVRNFDEAE